MVFPKITLKSHNRIHTVTVYVTDGICTDRHVEVFAKLGSALRYISLCKKFYR